MRFFNKFSAYSYSGIQYADQRNAPFSNMFWAQLSVSPVKCIYWLKKPNEKVFIIFLKTILTQVSILLLNFLTLVYFPLWKQERFKILLEIQERIGDDYPLITASRVSTYQIKIATSIELSLHLRKVALLSYCMFELY